MEAEDERHAEYLLHWVNWHSLVRDNPRESIRLVDGWLAESSANAQERDILQYVRKLAMKELQRHADSSGL